MCIPRGVHALAARALFGAVLGVAAGCGARSGVELDGVDRPMLDAGPREAGPRDAGAPRDAGSSPCPPPSDFGFTLVPVGPLEIDVAPGEVSLGGDGVRVLLAATAADPARPGALVELGPTLAVLDVLDLPAVRLPRLSVVDGTYRFASVGPLGQVVLLSGRTVSGFVRTETTIFRGPLVTLARPAWNGSEVVIAGQNGFEVFLGAFVSGGAAAAWRSFGPATDVDAAAQPTTGITELLLRDGAGALRVETFAADGAALWPPGGVALEEIGLAGPLAFGWLDDDGSGQPLVLAGFSTEDGRLRAVLRRFRTDGAAAGGFSAPLDGMPGDVDLTTIAPPGHWHGYGMVAATLGGGAIFHGAGQDFVGDARAVPTPCEGEHVSIAAGLCGYVIACVAGGHVQLSLAVPPRPR